jgi:hypothetical protein
VRTLLTLTLTCLLVTTAFARPAFWAPLEPPRAHYSVDVRYLPTDQRLEGTETIRFRNDTRRPIDRIALRWFGEIVAVRAGGSAATGAPGKHSVALFDLPHAIAPGRELALEVDFSAPWKLDSRTASAITSSLHPRLWWGFGTHDDYVVRVHVPEGHVVATSGRLDASTGAYRADGVRAFGLFIGKGYDSAEVDAGAVRVRAVFTPKGRACAELLLKTAADVVAFYHQRFGFYPQSSLTIVPGGDAPMGGYPAATGLVVVHGQERMSERPDAHWRWITAHEIGHQYWGEHVLAAGAESYPWLMLGLGIHADREYSRARGISVGTVQAAYVEGVKRGTTPRSI